MASRPRPSLLALFDPLTISETSPSTPTRDTFSSSPSGSDKENLISTTPKGSCTKASDGDFWNFQAKNVERSRVEQTTDLGRDYQKDLLGSSFSLAPTEDDTSNLCLVQLADELASACKIIDPEDIVERLQGERKPLSEVSLTPPNGSRRSTPQNVARDKRLVDLDSPSTTPKSIRKFASGIMHYEPSTPPVSSPLASRRAGRTPQHLLHRTEASSVIHHTSPNAVLQNQVQPAPAIPFASYSPSLLSSTPVSDPNPAFHDPPSNHLGSSFEIHNSPYMKQMDLSGDLLNDDLSFLARMEEDSFTDCSRGSKSDRTALSSPKTPVENNVKAMQSLQTSHMTRNAHVDEMDVGHDGIKPQAETRTVSRVFRRSSSHTGVMFGTENKELTINLFSSTSFAPRTPTSSPLVEDNKRVQALAPKKNRVVLRGGNNTLTRSMSARVVQTVNEEEVKTSQQAKSSPLRSRPSSMDIKPLARSHSAVLKQKTDVTAPLPTRRVSVSRPSIGRRASVGFGLSSPKAQAADSTASQGTINKKPAISLTQSTRRLSVSASATPMLTPIKANNFATTGRLGGARRVPLVANAPFFKASESTIKEVPSPPKSVSRAANMSAKTGPQRPPSGALGSGTLGRSTARALVDRAPSVSGSSRMLGRAASVSSAVFSRSSFMTSSSGSSTSRLPLPPSKSGSRIPAPGTRKAFY